MGFYGVPAPNAKLRLEIIPTTPAEQITEPSTDHGHVRGAPARMMWARLLKRVFDIDIDHCPNCAGVLKIIDRSVIIRNFALLGLPLRPTALRLDSLQTA